MEETKAKWYVVHTYSGYENKVRDDLLQSVKNRNLEEQIFEVRIPTENEQEVKDGKTKNVTKKVYPCYVLIKMIMTDESWYVVRNTRGVTGFVGPGSKPVPLTPKEVYDLKLENAPVVVQKVSFSGQIGDRARIIGGPWDNTVGDISAINDSKGTVTINYEMFGRPTPVEVKFAEVEIIK